MNDDAKDVINKYIGTPMLSHFCPVCRQEVFNNHNYHKCPNCGTKLKFPEGEHLHKLLLGECD